MRHLHMRRQVLKSTRAKPTDIDLEDKIRQMYCFAQPWTLVQRRNRGFTHIYADATESHQAEEINTSKSCRCIILISS